jgi:hypothetical protein
MLYADDGYEKTIKSVNKSVMLFFDPLFFISTGLPVHAEKNPVLERTWAAAPLACDVISFGGGRNRFKQLVQF